MRVKTLTYKKYQDSKHVEKSRQGYESHVMNEIQRSLSMIDCNMSCLQSNELSKDELQQLEISR